MHCFRCMMVFCINRKIRHKNVVQFIGACTRPPHLCIVTGTCRHMYLFLLPSENKVRHAHVLLTAEFMSGGSVYEFLHKQSDSFKLPGLLKVAINVSKGMNFLHQNNIIHRDLKSANLLMDENKVGILSQHGRS